MYMLDLQEKILDRCCISWTTRNWMLGLSTGAEKAGEQGNQSILNLDIHYRPPPDSLNAEKTQSPIRGFPDCYLFDKNL